MRRAAMAIGLLALAGAASAQPAPDAWVTPPTPAQIAAAYPERAQADHVEGLVRVQCNAASSLGVMEGCFVVDEQPFDWGFGAAALTLARDMRVATAGPPDNPRPGGALTFYVRFTQHPERPQTPGGPLWLVKTLPSWYVMPTDDDMAWAYPDRANRRGLRGHAKMQCNVGIDGRLSDCAVLSEDPPDQGFGAAALKLARKFTLRPGTLDGAPAPSVAVVPIAFEPPRD